MSDLDLTEAKVREWAREFGDVREEVIQAAVAILMIGQKELGRQAPPVTYFADCAVSACLGLIAENAPGSWTQRGERLYGAFLRRCPKCRRETGQEILNYDMMWHDGDVHCKECGTRIRGRSYSAMLPFTPSGDCTSKGTSGPSRPGVGAA